MVKASYQGTGVEGTGNDIILILAFIAGLVIVFYVLAKKEIGSLGSGLASGLKETAKTIEKTVAETIYQKVPGYEYNPDTNLMESKTIVESALSKDELLNLYPEGYQVSGYNEFGQAWAYSGVAEEPRPIEGEQPSGYYYGSDGTYLLYGCDASGFNCTSNRKLGFWETIPWGLKQIL